VKFLNGLELAGFIKQRHAAQVRQLANKGVVPKLAIIRTNADKVVDIYMRLKTSYGEDIGALVEVHDIKQSHAKEFIAQLNKDESVHGIIVQLPLADPAQTDEILNCVVPAKDVDGLSSETIFDPATPTSILWLLNGYNIELKNKNIVVVGQGRLVGMPLTEMLKKSNYNVVTADKSTKNLADIVQDADIVISGTGQAGLVTSHMLKPGAVVVDAGTSTDSNGVVGDIAADARQRDDLTITPENGGVGPLTVCALFENLIRASANVKN
jgi:methylenetetrahydrofolate dehydrogenase (NADP+)/methenyltetrahydrofolate cyclohydrolase